MTEFTSVQKEFLESLFFKLNTTIDERTTETQKKVNEKAEEIKVEVTKQLNTLKIKLDTVEEENKNLKQHILSLERKVRKNNIAIFGIEENEENIMKTVCDVFHNSLGLQIREDDLNNVYLVKNINCRNKTPIIVELISYQKKLAILKNAKQLKGTNISIANDLCVEDRKRNKILLKHLKLARSKGNTAYIKGNKLVVSEESYTVEELETEIEISEDTAKPLQLVSASATPHFAIANKRLIGELDTEERNEQKKSKSENTRKDKYKITRSNSATKKT